MLKTGKQKRVAETYEERKKRGIWKKAKDDWYRKIKC